MKFANGSVGMFVISKHGLSDRGRIDKLNDDKTFGVTWLYQDGSEFSPRVKPGDVRAEPGPPKCPSCGQEITRR